MHHKISSNGEKTLLLQAKWNPEEVRAYMEKHGITVIFYREEFRETASMESVLAPYSFVRRLWVTSHQEHDWTFLPSFTCLEDLDLSVPYHSSIKLPAIAQLQKLHCPWIPDQDWALLTNLKTLVIETYTPINFEPLAGLMGLEFLGLLGGSIQSLKGISAFTSLKDLRLWNCRNLKWIAALNGLPQLYELLILGSRRVKDFTQLADLPALERLTIDFCGDIPSITFLRKLKSLKYIRLGGNTRVVDRNTRPLDEIPAAFYNRRDLPSLWGPRW